MKINKRQQKIAEIVNRIFFIRGWSLDGEQRQQWIIIPKEDASGEKMKLKLNSSIKEKQKMKLKVNSSIKSIKKQEQEATVSLPQLGDLVNHTEHPIGLGLVVEKHPKYNAFRVDWVEHSNLTLFIDAKYLVPINKEHTHESDDL